MEARKRYKVTIDGCDDSTRFSMDLTEEERHTIERVCILSKTFSTSGCMPTMKMVESEAKAEVSSQDGHLEDAYNLPQGNYTLSKVGSDIGDSGGYVAAVSIDPESRTYIFETNHIAIGKALQCGSVYARTYAAQDWWRTSAIVEFLEVDEEKSFFKFRTHSGSTYELRRL